MEEVGLTLSSHPHPVFLEKWVRVTQPVRAAQQVISILMNSVSLMCFVLFFIWNLFNFHIVLLVIGGIIMFFYVNTWSELQRV